VCAEGKEVEDGEEEVNRFGKCAAPKIVFPQVAAYFACAPPPSLHVAVFHPNHDILFKISFSIVTHILIARQRFGEHIPEAYAVNHIRTSTAR
jgi:hypothetical protein